MVEAGEQECGGGVSRRWRKGGWSCGQQLKQARSDCACGTGAAALLGASLRRDQRKWRHVGQCHLAFRLNSSNVYSDKGGENSTSSEPVADAGKDWRGAHL
jgi:hypothetical protein